MKPVFFDTHAHLHFPEFAADLSAVLDRAREAGVRFILTIGTDVEDSRAAVALMEAATESARCGAVVQLS